MHDLITKYTAKLVADCSAMPGNIAFAARDDVLISVGDPNLVFLAENVLSESSSLSIVAAQPPLPWTDFLVRRSLPEEKLIIPRDTETRTFLHDIPFLRREDLTKEPIDEISRLLTNRKGIIVEGVGIIAVGAMSIEQAFINYSSVFHAIFVKYLQDLLVDGFLLTDEVDAFQHFRDHWLKPLTTEGLSFRAGPLAKPEEILAEIATVGCFTVQRGLVDSYFGNISLFDGNTIYISQTASSLDELAGCIDPVPMDNSSTTGITASSELLAHRRIYETSDARVILHGHPKFAVVMSMLCEESNCPVRDCWKDCPRVRFLGDTPVVAGEIGAGGLARSVPPVIGESGKALVYGHGLFTIGRRDFEEAFRAMVDVENWCRDEYFRRFEGQQKHGREYNKKTP
jgi:ribulose-5-phosphate 4-epimerase/fuculose-1-phosphate aldolase